jgi:hypothetical protein
MWAPASADDEPGSGDGGPIICVPASKHDPTASGQGKLPVCTMSSRQRLMCTEKSDCHRVRGRPLTRMSNPVWSRQNSRLIDSCLPDAGVADKQLHTLCQMVRGGKFDRFLLK